MQLANPNEIPSLYLKYKNKNSEFVFKTMEEIHVQNDGKPDVPHRHDYFTILWAKNACGQHYIDYNEYPIRPNYLFFVSPEQVHQVVTYGEPKGYVILFTRDFLHKNRISEDFITELGLFSDTPYTPPILVSNSTAKILEEHIKQIESSFLENNQFRDDLLGAYLRLFLIECNKYIPELEKGNTQKFQTGKNIIRKFKILVEQKYVEWHKVSNYANELNLTADYLNNIVKSTIGKTAKEFIQQRINLEAKRLGIHTQLSNKEIAYKVGFDDPSHFSKFFKKNEGQAFSEFRKNLQNSLS